MLGRFVVGRAEAVEKNLDESVGIELAGVGQVLPIELGEGSEDLALELLAGCGVDGVPVSRVFRGDPCEGQERFERR
jgi:hypothetical protein